MLSSLAAVERLPAAVVAMFTMASHRHEENCVGRVRSTVQPRVSEQIKNVTYLADAAKLLTAHSYNGLDAGVACEEL